MPKFTLTCQYDEPLVKNILEFDGEFLSDILKHFQQFLKGCTYEFNGELEIVNNNYIHKPDEPDGDNTIAHQVFNNMASSLVTPTIHTTTKDAVSEFYDRCSICGISKSIMKNHVCYDPKCGIK